MDIALNANLLTDFRLGYYRYNVIDSKYSTAELANTWGIPGINTGNPFTSALDSLNQTGNGAGAFTLMLVVASMLMVRTMRSLATLDLGFDLRKRFN